MVYCPTVLKHATHSCLRDKEVQFDYFSASFSHLEEQVQIRYGMIDPFRIFKCDVGHQLGEGLQQLDKGQVILPAQRLRLVTR